MSCLLHPCLIFLQEYALFEPGCRHVASDIMGTNRANPTAMVLSATMMLRHLGYVSLSRQLICTTSYASSFLLLASTTLQIASPVRPSVSSTRAKSGPLIWAVSLQTLVPNNLKRAIICRFSNHRRFHCSYHPETWSITHIQISALSFWINLDCRLVVLSLILCFSQIS